MPPLTIACTIAGSDSGGGAGIQADLKTFHQFGVYGTSVVAAITAQNTQGVRGVHVVPAALVEQQFAALAEDLPPDACKSGMLATAELVELVGRQIRRHQFGNYVLDPVMVATSGDRLLDRDAERAMVTHLVPLATLVTPNIDEARILAEDEIDSVADMESAGRAVVHQGATAALIKGGHLESETITDVLVVGERVRRFTHSKIATSSTHGTGCTLSAAIAAGLALGRTIPDAVCDALNFVHQAIVTAPGLGRGHGPLNHFVEVPRP